MNKETKEQRNKRTKKQKSFLCFSVSLSSCLRQRRGQAALAAILAGMFISFSIGIGIGTVAFLNIQRLRNNTERIQSYYAAEGAIEDALLRVIDPDLEFKTDDSYSLSVGSNAASTTISSSGPNLSVRSDGFRGNSSRSLEVLLIATGGTSFSYGAQVGDGGVLMENNSVIDGSLYSGGDVVAGGLSEVLGSVYVSGSNEIDGATISADVHANTIRNSVIAGDAYYQTIIGTTVAGNSYPGSDDPEPIEMPISEDQISDWKNDAAAGGTIDDDYDLSGNSTASLGPIKINGDLNIQNTAVLTMTGTIWVTGNVNLQNSGAIELDESFGNQSGVMVVDGTVTINNSFALCGSEGFSGSACNSSGASYLLMLSTNAGDPAIDMAGTTNLNGILYAANGTLLIESNAFLKEATAYRLHIKNNAVIVYETGLIFLDFGDDSEIEWSIRSWKEVE